MRVHLRILMQLKQANHDRKALGDNPFADLITGRGDVAAGEVDDRTVALHFEDGGLAVGVSVGRRLSTSCRSTSGCREIRSNTHASVEAVVSCPAARMVSSSSPISPRVITEPSS